VHERLGPVTLLESIQPHAPELSRRASLYKTTMDRNSEEVRPVPPMFPRQQFRRPVAVGVILVSTVRGQIPRLISQVAFVICHLSLRKM
jgi:hypothetical protein